MRFLFTFTLLLSAITYCKAQYSQFDAGFQKGYKEGYCYQIYGCLPPIPPLTPLPTINENINSYKDGYNRGFLLAQRDQTNSNQKQQSNANQYDSGFSQYTPRNYGDPVNIEPNWNLLSQALKEREAQYQQYQNNVENKKQYYVQQIDLMKKGSKQYYENTLFSISQYTDRFNSFSNYKIELEQLNPVFVVNKYPMNSMTFRLAENLLSDLEKNNKKIQTIILKANATIENFKDNPNNIISGMYVSDSYELQTFNSVTNKLENSKTINGMSYIQFNTNSIIFKLADDTSEKISALQYSESQKAFYTGHDEVFYIDFNTMILKWFWIEKENGVKHFSVFHLKKQ